VLPISTVSKHCQSCNRMDQEGRTHFIDAADTCTQAHRRIFDFACMQSSIGQSESETASHLPPMAHAPVSHTVASWRSWFWPYKHMALQANVSANAKEHSSLCSVCMLGGKEVKARISLLVTCYSSVLCFSSVFPLVLIYSHHHWALPPHVGC